MKMKNIKTMNNKKSLAENNRRLGLIGATVSQEENIAFDCPSSEDLAVVVENPVIMSENRQQIATHISSCNSCYQEWLILSREHAASKKSSSNIIRLLTTSRYLAATGSVMAIAVSVVVFFAIPPDKVTEITAPQPKDSVSYMEESAESVSGQEMAGALQIEEALPMSVPKENFTQGSVRDEKRKEFIVRNKASLAKRKASVPLVSVMKGTEASSKVELKQADSVSSELTSIATYVELKEYLLWVCNSEDSNFRDIEKIQMITDNIISQSINIGESEYKKLELILSLYTEEPTLVNKQFCEQVKDILN